MAVLIYLRAPAVCNSTTPPYPPSTYRILCPILMLARQHLEASPHLPYRVHKVMRIERSFDDSHGVDRLWSQLFQQIVLLHKSYTMLACTGAFHFECPVICEFETEHHNLLHPLPVDHILDTLQNFLLLSWLLRVIHDSSMEVAITDVSKSTCEYAQSIQVLLCHLCAVD